MFNIQHLIDGKKCYATIRELRWPEGVRCPHCDFHWIKRRGFHTNQPHRQRYQCQSCERQFDDLTGTILARHHQPVKVWVLCLYFMGLNLSNQQIVAELGLNKDDVQAMTTHLRQGINEKKTVQLSGKVECDEVYLVAGHKGHPAAVQAQGRAPRRNRLKAKRGRGTLEGEKPPVLGMVQRNGQVVIKMLANVQQKTIRLLIKATIQTGATLYTDEYTIYGRLEQWGYTHQSVNHSLGAYARDEDGDGFHEVHTNTIEGVWSLLRSWLRPHRGLSQEKLPLYLGFFEFVYNARKRGQALLTALLTTLLAPCNPD
jgi:transposase-like protein